MGSTALTRTGMARGERGRAGKRARSLDGRLRRASGGREGRSFALCFARVPWPFETADTSPLTSPQCEAPAPLHGASLAIETHRALATPSKSPVCATCDGAAVSKAVAGVCARTRLRRGVGALAAAASPHRRLVEAACLCMGGESARRVRGRGARPIFVCVCVYLQTCSCSSIISRHLDRHPQLPLPQRPLEILEPQPLQRRLRRGPAARLRRPLPGLRQRARDDGVHFPVAQP